MTQQYTDLSDLELSSDESDFWLDNSCNEIIHLNDRQMVGFHTNINSGKNLTLWDTGASRSVTNKSYIENYT